MTSAWSAPAVMVSRVASRVSRVCVAKSRVPPTFGVPPSRRLRNTCRHVISWHPSHYPRASHTQTNAVEGTSSSSGDRSSGDTSVPAVFPETTSPSPSVDTASEAEDLDDDNEPVLSEAAQKANREVDAYVKTSSEQSTELCKPTAPNQYLPRRSGQFTLPNPPEPVRFPRTKLNLKLAVLLLRSGYETIDAMDILPMDQFQIKFWKSRQAEWEPYKFQYAPLTIEQGALEDPLYFDFISYVQFNVVSREIPKSASVFEERSGAEGTVKVIRRDPALSDKAILPAILAQRLGDTIYARLRYGFEDTEFHAPAPAVLSNKSDATAVEEDFELVKNGLTNLTKAMVRKGYGLRSDVSVVETDFSKKKQKLKIAVAGAANLWGAQALAAKGVSPTNEYLGFVLTAYCRATGVGSYYVTRASDVSTEIEFTVLLP